MGWRWVGERFDDEGYSGATLDRPAFQRLLEKVRRGEIHRVLVYSLDRLSRNVIDGLQLLQEFRQRGVALVVVTYPELGSAAQDNLIINILSVFAEFERELIRSRIAEVRAALKRQGKRVGGAVPGGCGRCSPWPQKAGGRARSPASRTSVAGARRSMRGEGPVG
ncbi:MAG: recombinase family protein [Deltaproteobacteria bacterium]|nr:recombinase family protein [Deltaproteobacteria bacterium]